jgi:hypothetical protein
MTGIVAAKVGLVRTVSAVLSSIRLLSLKITVESEGLGQTLELLVGLCGATLRWGELSRRTVGNSTTRGSVGCGHLSRSLVSAVDAVTSDLAALDLQGSYLAGQCLLWQGLLDEFRALQEFDDVGLENMAQLLRGGLGETHVIE